MAWPIVWVLGTGHTMHASILINERVSPCLLHSPILYNVFSTKGHFYLHNKAAETFIVAAV